MQISDFIELYIEAKENKKMNDLWLAYVIWQPKDLTFEQFANQKPEEMGGIYIDQIGL